MYSSSHMLQMAKAYINARAGKKLPFKVTQYVTYRCNLKCSFCGRRTIKSPYEMTIDEIKGCMREFKDMGALFWGINGGEPLLRPDIGEIVSYAKEMGFEVSMSTNGLLIPEKIDEIKALDLVIVSIDGPETIHDSIRGKGKHRVVLKSLEVLRSHKIKTFIMTVLNRTNLSHLDPLLKISEGFGCHHEFQPITLHRGDTDEKARDYFPEHSELVRAIDWLIEQKGAGRPVANSLNYLKLMKNYPSPLDIDCLSSRLVCAVTPDGRIIPCSEMISHELDYESGIDKGFKEAFNALPDMVSCRECFFSCYAEYNTSLNAPVRTFFKFLGNIPRGRWIWE